MTAMLIAGGESRRMGTDKATLVFEGEPLWQRQLRLLRSLKPQKLCVSARVRPAWCPSDIETILDIAPSRGPLSGIAAGLSQLQTSHLLVLAIDMPRMSSDHLNKLIRLAAGGCGVVPQKMDSFEPLCAVYPAEAAAAAAEALARGNVSLQLLLKNLRAAGQMKPYLLFDSEIPLYQNFNSPGDLG